MNIIVKIIILLVITVCIILLIEPVYHIMGGKRSSDKLVKYTIYGFLIICMSVYLLNLIKLGNIIIDLL